LLTHDPVSLHPTPHKLIKFRNRLLIAEAMVREPEEQVRQLLEKKALPCSDDFSYQLPNQFRPSELATTDDLITEYLILNIVIEIESFLSPTRQVGDGCKKP